MRDVTISLFSRLLIIAAGVFTSIITARQLGVIGRGEYFFLVTVANLVAQFSTFGLPASNTYFVAKTPAWSGRLIANSRVIGLVGGSFIALVVSFLLLLLKEIEAAQVVLLPVLIVALLYGQLTAGILIGKRSFQSFNTIQIVGTLLQILLFLLSFIWVLSSTTFILFSTISSVVIVILQVSALNRIDTEERVWDPTVMRASFTYAWRVYAMTLIGFLISRGGAVLLMIWSNSVQLGYFSVAIQFFDVLAIIPATCAMVLFPRLAELTTRQSRAKTVMVAITVGLVMAVICTVLALSADWLIPLLFGAEFGGVIPVLRLMLPGAVSLAIANIFSQHLASRGIPMGNIFSWVVCFGIFISFGYRYIPEGGAQALASSLTLGYSFLMISLGFLVAVDKPRSVEELRE